MSRRASMASVRRARFRKAIWAWSRGEETGDNVIKLAHEVDPTFGGPVRVYRHVDLRPYLARGHEEWERVVGHLLGEFEWLAGVDDWQRCPTDPKISDVSFKWGHGTTPYGLMRTSLTTFVRAGYYDIIALRLRAQSVDRALSEAREIGPRHGCDPWDPRTASDRPWTCAVLCADPSGGSLFRGRRGDLAEEWLEGIYQRGGTHGFELSQRMCDEGLSDGWTDRHAADALSAAGWIRRGEMRGRVELCPFEVCGGFGKKDYNLALRHKLGRDMQNPDDMHPAGFLWHPTGHSDALAFLLRSRSVMARAKRERDTAEWLTSQRRISEQKMRRPEFVGWLRQLAHGTRRCGADLAKALGADAAWELVQCAFRAGLLTCDQDFDRFLGTQGTVIPAPWLTALYGASPALSSWFESAAP